MSSTKCDFLYLNEQDLIRAGAKDMKSCVDTMEEVVKLINAGDYMMSGQNHNSHGAMVSFPDEPKFPGMPKNGCDRRFMAMPAYLGGAFDIAGMKWYGSNVENKKRGLPRSVLMLMLNDKETALPLALMSANLISSYRTGAMSGVGARFLARKDTKVAGIVGPGVMGKTALHSFVCECPKLDTVKVKGRGEASMNRFMEYIKQECPQIRHIEVVDSIEAAVRDSDIVCVSTSSPVLVQDYPFIKEEWIKKGALLCLPATVNFDDDFIANRCKKVVDNMELYNAWAEEYPYPTFGPITIIGTKFTDLVHEGKINALQIDDLGDIINGKKAGRISDDEIVLYSVGGMPVEDVAWGKTLYQNAVRMGVGTTLSLWDVPEMS